MTEGVCEIQYGMGEKNKQFREQRRAEIRDSWWQVSMSSSLSVWGPCATETGRQTDGWGRDKVISGPGLHETMSTCQQCRCVSHILHIRPVVVDPVFLVSISSIPHLKHLPLWEKDRTKEHVALSVLSLSITVLISQREIAASSCGLLLVKYAQTDRICDWAVSMAQLH